VRLDGAVDQDQTVVELRFPQLLAPFDELLATPDVVDQDVEIPDLLEQPRDLLRLRVIDLHRYPAAAPRRDDLRRLVDRLGAVRHPGGTGHAPAGAVDGRARFAERRGDPASCPARGPGDDGDLSGKRSLHVGHPFQLQRFTDETSRGARFHTSSRTGKPRSSAPICRSSAEALKPFPVRRLTDSSGHACGWYRNTRRAQGNSFGASV